ncbi:MAG TPA: SPOR domain-containing protein [Gemmatimonadaceae bacterium]|nr:SPOR domain-containing protein [Gemmatimonadaceae bacterium]
MSAQTPARPTDPVFVRAQALVSDGNGAAGRALIDSMIAVTPPSAPLYPQALFWRASLAASAADAENDYKHIVVDYPLTPQAPEALLRLAQLELARGDREAALGHLQRIPRDYPRSKSLARANYWIARVFFEKNDLANGCTANANALAQLDSTEIELRNQIQYQGQRCPAPGAAPVVTQTPPASVVASPPIQVQAAPGSQPTASGQATSPSQLVPVAPAPSVVSSQPAVVPDNAPTRPEYSVQLAAYKIRADADKLVENLKMRGYEARVDVSPDWFRVRVGRYPSESAAEAQLREMKAKQMSGFVVRAPDR